MAGEAQLIRSAYFVQPIAMALDGIGPAAAASAWADFVFEIALSGVNPLPLTRRFKSSTENHVLRKLPNGTWQPTGQVLTDAEYAALAVPGAGPPPGVSATLWNAGEICAMGGVPNYQNGRFGRLGEDEIVVDGSYVYIALRRIADDKLETVRMLSSSVGLEDVGGILSFTIPPPSNITSNYKIVTVTNGELITA